MEQTRQLMLYVETRVRRVIGNDRGDVPGWVMITLMTAALVAIVWGLASGWLRQLFGQAQNQVTGINGTGGTGGGAGAGGGAPAGG